MVSPVIAPNIVFDFSVKFMKNGRPANYLSRQIEGGPLVPLLMFDDELVVLVVNRDSPKTLHCTLSQEKWSLLALHH